MTRRVVHLGVLGVAFAVWLAASLTGTSASQLTGAAVRIDNDDIGGVVTSPKGPEAGVWVVVETRDLPTKFVRSVVTDDQGRYVMPDLPKATYDVWVRGYGLVDSPHVRSVPGKILNLKAVVAPDARAAAQYYPATYWLALLQIPTKSDFPGTGLSGNGIPPTIKSQGQWIAQFKGCEICHQLGDKATREIEKELGTFPTSVAAWDRRTQSGQFGSGMTSALQQLGRQRMLSMFGDWTDRIVAGEIPPVAPPRPQGLERNLVVTLWDWSDAKSFVHDTASTDKRNPLLNPNGPVYSVSRLGVGNDLNILYPTRNAMEAVSAPVRDGNWPDAGPRAPQTMMKPSPYWGDELIWQGVVLAHNPMLDQKSRVWITQAVRPPGKQAFCKQGSSHPSAKYFPLNDEKQKGGDDRQLSFYDPKTKQFTLIDTCFGTHSLMFAEDANNTLWVSGNTGAQVVGFVNTKLFDETHDEQKSQGWIPFILDTNGNGKVDAWVEPDAPVDPTKDKRIAGGAYGIVPNPVDGSIWMATAKRDGGIIRVNPGSNPPYTSLSEYYEPPNAGGFPRGIDVDRKTGLIWTALAGSGHIASFDRRKCKVLNGPTATGKHCPEGWTLYASPEPKFKNATDIEYSTEVHYRAWVDQFNALGLGENVPLANGTGSDSLKALLPDTGKFVVLRVPYPMGFFSRGVDGRIDDPKTGWKGRGLWANYGMHTPWHIEGGKGTTSKAVKFQIRPDPLAK